MKKTFVRRAARKAYGIQQTGAGCFIRVGKNSRDKSAPAEKGIGYTLNHREYFSNFLLNGQIPISNNSSEQAVKIVALNRKNSLFSDSIAGANASACVFSFISTAMSNGLDAYEYLNYLFTELPGKDLTDCELLKQYLPWSENVQEACKMAKEYLNGKKI